MIHRCYRVPDCSGLDFSQYTYTKIGEQRQRLLVRGGDGVSFLAEDERPIVRVLQNGCTVSGIPAGEHDDRARANPERQARHLDDRVVGAAFRYVLRLADSEGRTSGATRGMLATPE